MSSQPALSALVSRRRLWALCRKESVQILRDPSSILIAFVLPVIMIFLFGYGINLDTGETRIGMVVEDSGAEAWQLADAIAGSPFLKVVTNGSRGDVEAALQGEEIRGFVVIPSNFSRLVAISGEQASIQIVTDGSVPNTAAFVANYVTGSLSGWAANRAEIAGTSPNAGIQIKQRYWFNAATTSRNSLVPGSIVIVMTVVGALLTSLVVAREWERGTMEALLSTPVTKAELLLSKLLPYFALGLGSMLLCVGIAVWMLGVPFRGSFVLLVLATSLFLGTALGLGLLLSTVLKNQFNAAQGALNAAFLPALMLSGFVYEIASMPWPVQVISSILPARYFVTILQTLFQSDYAGALFWMNAGVLALIAAIFLSLIAFKTQRTLD
ncbi:ABC transporter permease [Novosphingopyxis sp.]|uniref:ABC transporter permease n=1 Tax=Novosphingopyxis sp. TaxID=2709690 RepID=UPI003B5CC9FB